jgi:DNA processing protein
MNVEGQKTSTLPALGEPVRVSSDDSRFPPKLLGLKQPPKELYAAGNLALSNRPSVAIVGSRHSSEHGLETTSRIARAVAEAGIVVISGYAKGVDTAAHVAALEASGDTVFVLPFGFKHFHVKRELKPLVSREHVLAISQFAFGQPWFASAAMKRNEVVCGLADCVIVIEAGESGGTVEAARTARALDKRLYIVEFKQPAPSAVGNAHLISTLQAQPIRSLRDIILLIQETANGNLRLERGELSAQPTLF